MEIRVFVEIKLHQIEVFVDLRVANSVISELLQKTQSPKILSFFTDYGNTKKQFFQKMELRSFVLGGQARRIFGSTNIQGIRGIRKNVN